MVFENKISYNTFTSVIKTLARNDANKKLLVHLGALKLLVKLTKGNTEETIGNENLLCSSFIEQGSLYTQLRNICCILDKKLRRNRNDSFVTKGENETSFVMTKPDIKQNSRNLP